MRVSKTPISSAAAAAIVSVIGLAHAETSGPGTGDTAQMQEQTRDDSSVQSDGSSDTTAVPTGTLQPSDTPSAPAAAPTGGADAGSSSSDNSLTTPRASTGSMSTDSGSAMTPSAPAATLPDTESVAIVDKKAAKLFVFDRDFRLAGATTVLIGQARGDKVGAAEGLVDLTTLRPGDRTTPAGRFDSEPGHNHRGEPIVWVDYAASFAIHRLRPAPPREHRPERLASANVGDKRISLGCVVVPVAFYERVVDPVLGHGRGVVYVLPESRPVETLFDDVERLASR